ncbi:MAG TPA: hypothetical protein VIV11_33850 [Kofleriaceae bacterium]
MTLQLTLLIALVTACTPSINQAARTDVDRRIATLTPSDRRVDAPLAATPQPLAVGQWITLRQTDREQRPSLSTLKIVGAEGDAFWLEVVTDSYFGSSGMKMLVAFGDRTDPTRFEIRRAVTRDGAGRVTEMPSAVIQFMRSTFQPVLDSMVLRWDALPQQDASVAAGTFTGCYHGRSSVAVAGQSTTSEVWWHPEVPINGVVKTVGVGEPTATELVDFGREGARSSF